MINGVTVKQWVCLTDMLAVGENEVWNSCVGGNDIVFNLGSL